MFALTRAFHAGDAAGALRAVLNVRPFPREGTEERPQRGGKNEVCAALWFGKARASCQTEGWEPSVTGGHKENGLFPLRYPLPAPTHPLFMAESDLILCICFIYLITVLNESFSKKNTKPKDPTAIAVVTGALCI